MTGKTGQIGSALVGLLGDKAIGLGRDQLDLSAPETIHSVLKNHTPSVVINAAAYTAVDKAEDESELVHKINADSVGKIAEYCFSNNIIFIHYSTDYVFSGEGIAPWKDDDQPDPQNIYGKTKLAGENTILDMAEKFPNAKYLIFRTSWVYSESGNNFLNTMLRLGKEKEELSIVSDQIGAPSYAKDIAEYTIDIIEKAIDSNNFPSGIYNLSNSGETSWYGFAEEIFEIAKKQGYSLKIRSLNPIKTSEYPTKAIRPLNSRLDNSKILSIFNINMPDWNNALKRCMEKK